MPYNPTTGSNAAFGEGQNHQANEIGHTNAFMLGNDARAGDEGLDASSDRWNSLTPVGVTQTASTGQADPVFEQLQREQGGYAPGQMPALADRVEQGSDSAAM
ncbi:MAG: hypothetical protein ACRDRJ_05060 [Streptosporangiaceae bacterium]